MLSIFFFVFVCQTHHTTQKWLILCGSFASSRAGKDAALTPVLTCTLKLDLSSSQSGSCIFMEVQCGELCFFFFHTWDRLERGIKLLTDGTQVSLRVLVAFSINMPWCNVQCHDVNSELQIYQMILCWSSGPEQKTIWLCCQQWWATFFVCLFNHSATVLPVPPRTGWNTSV